MGEPEEYPGKFPDYGLDEPMYFNLGVFRDCLCFFVHTETFLDIWLMNDYGNKYSWTKLFSVLFAEFIDCENCPPCADRLYIAEEDDRLFLDFDNKIYVYNYKNGTVKISEIQGLPSTSFTSNVYIESLISP
ncbi:F-box protein [Trifolium medium]|uniref:F-box protein n=1 Tax=Trifolium medium TaxID=97028 RepID=A0A392Q2E7_9FABA|nr:F-box protein [Trifolium medium]